MQNLAYRIDLGVSALSASNTKSISYVHLMIDLLADHRIDKFAPEIAPILRQN